MDRRSWWFFCLAFAWTWAWQAPLVLGYEGPLWLVLLAVAAIGPSLAAIVVTRGLALRLLRPSARWWWIVVALALPLVIHALAVGADAAVGGPSPVLVAPAIGAIVLPPIGEELGWRGFAYPRLAARWGAPGAALLVGIAWGLWHLPTALMPGGSVADFPAYFVVVVSTSLWMAWLFERSGRCTVVAIAAHAGINAGVIGGGLAGPGALVVMGAIGIVAAVALRKATPGSADSGRHFSRSQKLVSASRQTQEESPRYSRRR